MPKGILEFNLDEEKADFIAATKANYLVMTIDEIFTEVFRKRWKYDLTPEDEALSKLELIEKMRDECLEIVRANGVEELIQ